MKVTVNGKDVFLPVGATVRHALIGAGLMGEIEKGKKAYDQWGNEVGLSGALWDGAVLEVR